jgi:hypothetical protein
LSVKIEPILKNEIKKLKTKLIIKKYSLLGRFIKNVQLFNTAIDIKLVFFFIETNFSVTRKNLIILLKLLIQTKVLNAKNSFFEKAHFFTYIQRFAWYQAHEKT